MKEVKNGRLYIDGVSCEDLTQGRGMVNLRDYYTWSRVDMWPTVHIM